MLMTGWDYTDKVHCIIIMILLLGYVLKISGVARKNLDEEVNGLESGIHWRVLEADIF